MRLLVVGCILLCATPSLAMAQDEDSNRADWGQWARAFSAYADFPSDSNAHALRTLLASAKAVPVGTPPPFDSLADWLAMLARQVEARDPAAVRLAFALERSMGGGDTGETLDIMLGKLIRIDPRLFLRELRRDGRTPDAWIMGNTGEEYVDRMRADCHELMLRAAALEQVTDSALSAVKRRSIKALEAAQQESCR